ncbi:MAG: hypothetical protein ACRC46_14820 [Thermoguttaceae bacterium]
MQNSPELAEVIRSWDSLPDAIKSAVTMLIRSTAMATQKTIAENDIPDKMGSVSPSAPTPSRRKRQTECVPV